MNASTVAAGGATLGTRELNRAMLARQLLLDRADLPVADAIGHLVGMQSQSPAAPYVGLWSRLAGFRPDDLVEPMLDRAVVRVAVMRGTVHTVTAADCLWLRPMVQPLFDRDLRTNQTHGPPLAGIDWPELLTAGRRVLATSPCTPAELGVALAPRWPDRRAASLGYAMRGLWPLVQVPPRGIWGRSGRTTYADAERWLGATQDRTGTLDQLFTRYLGAFGPATVRDAQRWSGLTRLREVADRLRPGLRVFRDGSGRELFDLPGAPRPGPDVPAPVRFLPEFDNVLFSYADRGRVMSDGTRTALFGRLNVYPRAVLVDGFVAGRWRVEQSRGTTTLHVGALRRWSARERDAVHAEGARLLPFLAPGAAHDIRITGH